MQHLMIWLRTDDYDKWQKIHDGYAHKRKGFGIYTIEGQVAVDRLGRYEDLEAELERFGERVGLPGPLAVPRTKDSQRSDRRHYREVLRDEDAEKIAKLFADEIALLGYEY